MSDSSSSSDHPDNPEYEPWQIDRIKIRHWLINKFDLDEYPSVSNALGGEDFEQILEMLPILREICAENISQNRGTHFSDFGYDEEIFPAGSLEASKFHDVFLILTLLSTFGDDDFGMVVYENDWVYIYTEMCLKFCEWLTTEERVIGFFEQKRLYNQEEYVLENKVKLHKIVFDKNSYLESIKNEMAKILTEVHQEVNLLGIQEHNNNFWILQPEDTIFFKSIIEWFNLDTHLDIELYFRKNDSSNGIFSQGYKRFDEWDPRYRLMIYSSLIRKTFFQRSQLCFIFHNEVKLRLRDLIQKGEQCLITNGVSNDFCNFKAEDLIYEFQNLCHVASLFINKNGADIFDHCSKIEQIRSNDIGRYLDFCFERTFFPKNAVLMSSLSRNSQKQFEKICKTFESFNLPNDRYYRLQKKALWLKEGIERAIFSIANKPKLGVSAVTRKYNEFKIKHMALYELLGIPTNIQKNHSKGRRTEILFYHQNKDLIKLENEMIHLPKSLSNVVKLFSDTDCIVLTPYLNLITISHIVQFTLCANSLGRIEIQDDDIMLDMFSQVENVIKLLKKWGFKNTPYLMREFAGIFCDSEGYGHVVGTTLTRSRIVTMQSKIKEIYENNIKLALHFPPLIPLDLSPYFPDGNL
tara:strand:- start:8 stop:1918 length:1911 start_codon:yes stop_codon:yes gene_type:complete